MKKKKQVARKNKAIKKYPSFESLYLLNINGATLEELFNKYEFIISKVYILKAV